MITKKTILTLAIIAGVSCTVATAKGKKDKTVQQPEPVKEVVTLTTANDSLCYAAGQTRTNGLMEYVEGELNVDTAYTQAFIDALRAELELADSPEQRAASAGHYIGFMLKAQMADQLKAQLEKMNTPFNADMMKRGFLDAVCKDASVMSTDEAGKYFSEEMQKIQNAAIEAKKADGVKWLAENKTREGVQITPSGLQYRVIRQGNGPIAKENDEVEVKYEGKLIDGTVFDSSYQRNPQTTSFKPTQVIKGWTEALCMMPEGSEWELYIPEELGYGSRDAGRIPAYSTLIFKVEVVKVTPEAKEEPAAAQPVVKKAPAKKPVARKK